MVARFALTVPAPPPSRLDLFLVEQGVFATRSQASAAIRRGDVAVNGLPASKAGLPLKPGDAVAGEVRREENRLLPEPMPLAMLFEDSHLLVVDKPPGLVVHPAPGHRGGTLVNGVIARCPDMAGVGAVGRPGVVHRLDRGTSGLLVLAKDESAYRGLQAQFSAHTVERAYLAVVAAAGLAVEGVFDTGHARSRGDRTRFTGRSGGVGIKRRAVTRWRRLAVRGGLALVEARLETGRTHQIRVHFAESGHPVAGDPAYGRLDPRRLEDPAAKRLVRELRRQALHAWLLGFAHPTGGEALRFRSPPPADLQPLIAYLLGPEADGREAPWLS